MSREEETEEGVRFPGFDVVSQRRHWDPTTARAVLSRIGVPADIRFFTPHEQRLATALCDRLLGQDEQSRLPIVTMIDSRLAEGRTDGWHYEDMPADGNAWRRSLTALDADARARFGSGFADCSAEQQAAVIQDVQDLAGDAWHGLPAQHVWSLKCTGPVSARCASSSLPQADNRVTLADETDRHGLRVARFSYTQCDNDRALMRAAQGVMEDILRAAGADEVITIGRYAHLVGGARMARDEAHGVVDSDCRSFAVSNLLITDGSVLPTQGSANPALTIMAVAARAAERLATRQVRA